MSLNLWLSDSSPLFFYSPASQYFSSPLAPWTGTTAFNSSHSTMGTAGVILPSIYSSGFVPQWTDNSAFELYLGSDVRDLRLLHSAIRVPRSLDIHRGRAARSVIIDDANSAINYTGFSPAGSSSSHITASSLDYDQTLSLTSTSGAIAQLEFIGSSISISGVTSSSSGDFAISIDSNQVDTLSSYNNVTIHDVVLYFQTNLDTSTTHTFVLETTDGAAATGLVIDSITVYGPSGTVGIIGTGSGGATTTIGPNGGVATATESATSSAPATGIPNTATATGSPSAGTIVGAVLGSLAGAGLLFWLVRRAAPKITKPKEKKLNPWDQANLLQNMKNEEVHVTTAANQRYVYPGLIAHSELKK
ncbi:hypothetical protein P7C73_g385, partial [Tremellales sp. Uapishka_1]